MSRLLELEYTGPCDSTGAIKLPKLARKEIGEAFAGKTLQVRIRIARKSRSDRQNRYYWGVVIPAVLQAFIDLGNEGLFAGSVDSANLIHEFLKNKFLPPLEVANATGEVERMPGSTRKLTTSEFMDYIAAIQMWAAEFLFITIPDPGEQLELWANNEQ